MNGDRDTLINLTCRWWLPEGFKAEGRRTLAINNHNAHHSGTETTKFTLTAGDSVDAVNRCVLELMPEGRSSPLYIPIVPPG